MKGRPQYTMTTNERDILIALMEKYKRNKVAELLGIDRKSLYNRLKNDPVLSKYINTRNNIDFTNLVEFFKLGFSTRYLADKYNCSKTLIRSTLVSKMGKESYKKTLKTLENIKQKMGIHMNTENWHETNKQHLVEIIEKMRENKIHELSDEHLYYAKILFDNGFITKTGEITKEGKDALYH